MLDITGLNVAELTELKTAVASRIKRLNTAESLNLSLGFEVGDKVNFKAGKKGKLSGVITKTNALAAKVLVGKEEHRVSYTRLSK